MMQQRRSRVWPFIRNTTLLGAIAGLAALNWQIWKTAIDISPVQTAGDRKPSISSEAEPAISVTKRPAVAQYRETLARPMFRPDRRPFVAEAEPPPPPAMPEPAATPPPETAPAALPEGLRLVGVMKNGSSGRALVRTAQSPAGVWLELGEEIEGWKLAEVGSSAAQFANDDSRITVDLYPLSKPAGDEGQ